MSLWTLDEIVAATGGRTVGQPDAAFGSVSIDSREIEPGALFVAIKGDRVDGHDYVDKALAAGAAGALVSETRVAGLPQERLIVVPDALDGLRSLGAAARARSNAQIVAVTGSAGKTTTKEAIRTMLEAAGHTHASIRSFNNHWGVPLMLARLPRHALYGVFEIGMNHAGEITPLTRLVRPHIAVVTTVAAAHLEFFDSIEAIAEAKAEIFLGVEPGGTAVLNADHPYLPILVRRAKEAGIERIVTYGFSDAADVRIAIHDGGVLAVDHGKGFVPYLTPAVEGRHMFANIAAALVVGEALHVRASAIGALAEFEAPEGRGATVALGPADKPLLLIDQSYNANSASMAAALDVFSRQKPAGRKVLVLGDMLELGKEGPRLHAELRDAVIASGAERIYLVGTPIAALGEALGKDRVTAAVTKVDDIVDPVLSGLAYGDAVMVKGSNGVGLAGLVKKIRERFA